MRRRKSPWGERPSRKKPGSLYALGDRCFARWSTKTPDLRHVPKHAEGTIRLVSRPPGASEARYYVEWRGNPVAGWYGESSLLPFIPTDVADRDVARLHGLARRRGLRLSQVDRRQLAKGTHVEKEHTRSRRVARRIALDHLAEHPRYYDKLEAAGLDARRSRRRAVRRDPPGTRCPVGTKVQTLLLARAEFRSASAARAWAREHGFSDAKVDPDVHFFRLRQAHPHAFRAGSLRTIHLRPGVMAVVGCPK